MLRAFLTHFSLPSYTVPFVTPSTLSLSLRSWILYPPHQPPPGVVVSGDGTEIATPVSVMEWCVL
jgi:hypothetical protein